MKVSTKHADSSQFDQTSDPPAVAKPINAATQTLRARIEGPSGSRQIILAERAENLEWSAESSSSWAFLNRLVYIQYDYDVQLYALMYAYGMADR